MMENSRSDGKALADADEIGNDRKWAKALHDGPCQDLTTLSFFSEILAKRLAEEGHPLADQAAQMRDLLKKTSEELRTLTHQMPTFVPREKPKASVAARAISGALRVRYE